MSRQIAEDSRASHLLLQLENLMVFYGGLGKHSPDQVEAACMTWDGKAVMAVTTSTRAVHPCLDFSITGIAVGCGSCVPSQPARPAQTCGATSRNMV